jgi:transcriptional regulator of arginine metabolism
VASQPEINPSFNGLVSLAFSGHLGIVKTRPGYAMAIASDIDQSLSHIILGTIAGDDTILLIPHEGIEREKVKEALGKKLKGFTI